MLILSSFFLVICVIKTNIYYVCNNAIEYVIILIANAKIIYLNVQYLLNKDKTFFVSGFHVFLLCFIGRFTIFTLLCFSGIVNYAKRMDKNCYVAIICI